MRLNYYADSFIASKQLWHRCGYYRFSNEKNYNSNTNLNIFHDA